MKEITIEDVRNFLNNLFVKMDVYDMVFSSRPRCRETMFMLDINEALAKQIIKDLEATDYSKYFEDDTQWDCDLWAFGTEYKEEEIYIKIGLGKPNKSTICVSFHKADFPIKYEFK